MAGKRAAAIRRIKQGDFLVPSPEQVDAAGPLPTAMQFAEWGILWPPPKGWRIELMIRWYEARKQPNTRTDRRIRHPRPLRYLEAMDATAGRGHGSGVLNPRAAKSRRCPACGATISDERKAVWITDGSLPNGTLKALALCSERCSQAWKDGGQPRTTPDHQISADDRTPKPTTSETVTGT